jgi:hypothetical protein
MLQLVGDTRPGSGLSLLLNVASNAQPLVESAARDRDCASGGASRARLHVRDGLDEALLNDALTPLLDWHRLLPAGRASRSAGGADGGE